MKKVIKLNDCNGNKFTINPDDILSMIHKSVGYVTNSNNTIITLKDGTTLLVVEHIEEIEDKIDQI